MTFFKKESMPKWVIQDLLLLLQFSIKVRQLVKEMSNWPHCDGWGRIMMHVCCDSMYTLQTLLTQEQPI